MQDLVSNLHLDVLHQVFIDGDCGGRRAAVPFDPERSAGINVGKGIEIRLLGNHMAVATNSTYVATRECEEDDDRKDSLLHRKMLGSDVASCNIVFYNIYASALVDYK